MRAFFRWSCSAIACVLLFIEPDIASAANKYVIIAADPPIASLPLGNVLKVDDEIDVPAGTMLTLLGDDGSVTTVTGPQRLIVTSEPESDSAEARETRSTFQRIADLLVGSSDTGEVLGGRRSIGKSADGRDPVDPWAVPVEYPGNACLQSNAITFRRSGDLEERPVSVTINDEDEVLRAHWPKDQANLKLPTLARAPVKTIKISLENETSTFSVHVLPSKVEARNGMNVLAWMLEKGCKVQAINFGRWLSEN